MTVGDDPAVEKASKVAAAVDDDLAVEAASKQTSAFGELLRRARESRNLQQQALAERMHRSVSLISLLESGRRRVTRQVFTELRDALRLTPDEEAALLRAAGFPVDDLDRALQQVVDVIAQQLPLDDVDRNLMLADLTATTTGWRDLIQGKARTLKGELDQAHERFTQLTQRTELTPLLAAYAQASLADISEKLGKLSKAEQSIREAQSRMQQCDPEWGTALRAEIDAVHAMVAVRRGHYEMAAALVHQGEVQYSKMPTDDAGSERTAHIGLAKSYNRRALLALLRGEPDEALIHCDTAETHLSRVNQDPGDRRRLRIQALRAWALSQQKHFDDARRLHTQVRAEYERLGDRYGIAKSWLYLGDDYRQEIEAVIGDETEDPSALHHGDQRERQRELLRSSYQTLEAAERCYREAIALLGPTGEQILVGRCWRSLGDILRLKSLVADGPERASSYTEARQCLNRAWTLESEIGQGRRIPTVFQSLARLEWASGFRSDAEQYYRAALDALDSPLITAADAAGKSLREQCDSALGAIEALQAGGDVRGETGKQAPVQDGDVGGALEWRKLCEGLVTRLASAVAEGDIKPIATSDVDTKWLQALSNLEAQDGPRILAQNTLSVALSSSLPAGCPAEDAHFHKKRVDWLRMKIEAAHAAGGRNSYRDLCCRAAVERGFENEANRVLYLREFAQAIELLRAYPKGYALATSVYELPLAFAVKGDTVLVKVPRRLVKAFLSPASDVRAPELLCYCIERDLDLARDLGAIFNQLVALAQASTQRQESPIVWLKTLENSDTRSTASASAL